MAGIGFELKKLYASRGGFSKVRAVFYSSIVIAGPMIMGALLLFGQKYLSIQFGASSHEQDVIIVITTYSLLFPLLLTSFFSYMISRYIADKLYQGEYKNILPSMYGLTSILLLIGSLGWGIFLYLADIPFHYAILSFILFCSALVAWVQITYITAVKYYRDILSGFIAGIFTGLLAGVLLILLFQAEVVTAFLTSACIAYGIMVIVYVYALHKYFPLRALKHKETFEFLKWIKKYPSLSMVGFFTTLGLFIHLMLMWKSPWGIQVIGLFYHAPMHDIPALFAFLSILVTTVNFVTSVEVNFYPKYQVYFGLINNGGALTDIKKAHSEMLIVLKQELFYLALRQMFATIIFVVIVSGIISNLGLGFTHEMIGLYRVMCVGYAFYAIGNSMMLILLYFVDFIGAVFSGFTLLLVNTIGTLYTISLSSNFYGFGFLVAGLTMCLVTLSRLSFYTRRLDYFIFCKQPIFVKNN
jgi:uncharacterized membrane protein